MTYQTVRLFAFIILCMAWSRSHASAQSGDEPVGVPVRIWMGGLNPGRVPIDFTASASMLPSTDLPYGDLYFAAVTSGVSFTTGKKTARMEPGKVYAISVETYNLHAVMLYAVPPPGYQIEIAGVNRRRFSWIIPSPSPSFPHTDVVLMRVYAPGAEFSGRAGTASSLDSGRIHWQVALGDLLNGRSAGALGLIDAGQSTDWTSVFTPAGLQYTSLSSEVVVHRNTGSPIGDIKQIIAKQTIVDVVTTSATSYELKFYNPGLKVGASPPYTFSGDPYVTYRIEKNGGDTKLKLTSIAGTRTAVTTLERTGSSPANYQWFLKNWDINNTSPLVVEERTWGGTVNDRTDAVVVKQPGQANTTTKALTYQVKNWGEVVLTASQGDTNSITNTYDYYADSGSPGSYGFVKSISSNEGSWQAFTYIDAGVNSQSTGTVHRVFKPYRNTPSSVSFDVDQGEVTTYAYEDDAFEMRTRPTSIETKINGTILKSRAEIAYQDATGAGAPITVRNGLWVVKATRKDYTSPTNYQTTVSQYYREDTVDEFFRGQTYSIERSDGVKQVFAHQRGSWGASTFTKTGSDGLGAGTASRTVMITGTTDSSHTNYTNYDGYDVEDVYLVEGKSTMEVTIRDARAQVVRTETHAWKSSTWNLVGSVDFTYNAAGQLTDRVANNGANYSATFDGEWMSTETDETGVVITYTPDNAGRIATAAKASGPTTTLSYDAENRVTGELVAGGGETLNTLRSYDTAGRISSEQSPGVGAVTYSYSVANRKRTTTYPDTNTREEYYLADGRLEKIEGSAVVHGYLSYDYEDLTDNGIADPMPVVAEFVGAVDSDRCRKTWNDLLGRPVRTARPGFSQSAQAHFIQTNTYNTTTGQLSKTERTGLGTVYYEYDALSNVRRTGVDMGNDSGLDNVSADRITEYSQTFESDGGWWLKEETNVFSTLSSNAVVTASTVRRRLTGHTTGQLSETKTTDIDSNVATQTVTVDRNSATVTITTARPGLASPEVQTVVNGLRAAIQGHDGLTSEIFYDPLDRVSILKDPRENETITAYKTGSTLVETIKVGTADSITTYHYDSMGRRDWVKNAAGKYTRFGYNARGQLLRQWGDGSYPIAYGYDDAYGERTTTSSYRAALAEDSETWPTASVGTADTTQQIYDEASGLLWKVEDAPIGEAESGHITEYNYNERGQTWTRKWARKRADGTVPITATYEYYSGTGEFKKVSYNDNGTGDLPTPAVTYTYDRLGQVATVEDGTGTRTFNYNTSAPWRLDNETLDATYYDSRVFTPIYDTTTGNGSSFSGYTEGLVNGRAVGYELRVSGATNADLRHKYTLSNSGRLARVATQTQAGTNRDYVYGYQSGSWLLAGYTMGSLTVVRGYEDARDLLTSIRAEWSGDVKTRFDYTHDDDGRRLTAKKSGRAFLDYYDGLSYSSVLDAYGYNARGELQSSKLYRGSTSAAEPDVADALPGRDFEYRYDSVGNRKSSGTKGSVEEGDDGYETNELNQYTGKGNRAVRVVGTAAEDATVSVIGSSATVKKDRTWGAQHTPANAEDAAESTIPVYSALPGEGPSGTDLVKQDGKSFFIPRAGQTFQYDEDGNLKEDGVWSYVYDAENRLVRMTSLLPDEVNFTRQRLDFTYDYMGRRVEKRVSTINGDYVSYTETSKRRYVYSGWNIIAEIDGAGALQRTFAWGLDLTGSLTAAGGVGALMEICDVTAGKTFAPTYDGNGNVAALINLADGVLAAIYEYGPFGEALRTEGTYAKANPFRFSTKWHDDESGLVNYGFRYFSPRLGRFINRDPIGEQGGINLYGFCGNDGINHWDYLGQSWLSDALKKAGKWISKNWTTVVGVALNFVPGVGTLLSVAWNAGVGYHYGGAQGMLIGMGSSLIGGAIGGKIGGALVKQFGLQGLSAALVKGVSMGMFAGAAGAAAMGGNILEGALIGGISGGVISGGMYGIQNGAFGPGAQRTYSSASDWMQGVSSRIRNWIFGPEREGKVTLGPLRRINDDGSITELDGGGGPIGSGRMLNYGDGMRAPANSPIYGNNVRMTPETINIAARLQAAVESVNNRLAANPELAKTVLSDAEIRAASNPRVAPMAWGNAVERLFWEQVKASPELSEMVGRLGGPNRVDFMGIGAAGGLQFDITTVKGIPSHLVRPYGADTIILPYVRPF